MPFQDRQLTENFKLSEFVCPCGCHSDHIDMDLVQVVQDFRWFIKRKIKITSGVRCQAWNAHVRGAQDSMHLHGRAVDFTVMGDSPKRPALPAEAVFAMLRDFKTTKYDCGVGVYPWNNFCHVDLGPRRDWGRLENGQYNTAAVVLLRWYDDKLTG